MSPKTQGRTTWTNWAGNQSCQPVRIVTPTSVDELAAVVTRAAATGTAVKPIGSGHSFTDIGCTDGVQVRMDRLTGLIDAASETGLVTVHAGTTLAEIPGLLAPYGLAMENLGDIDQQTISGAISTGTHGTGARFGGIATQVCGLQIVLGDGSIVECSAEQRPELFAAARIGLGALGVITAVTLQCVPAFAIERREHALPLADVLGSFDELAASADHFEFFWFPHTDQALVLRGTRSGAGVLDPLSRWQTGSDRVLAERAFELTCRLGVAAPQLIPAINRIATRALSDRHYTDLSHRVFATNRPVRFRESEYAFPRQALVDVLTEIRSRIAQRGWRISFPLEVRVAAADDIWLSTAYERDSAYIAAHLFHRTPAGLDAFLTEFEQIALAAGGRPHWGKLHSLDAERVAERYPRFADFVRIRNDCDPHGTFTNTYLDRVLGHDRPSESAR